MHSRAFELAGKIRTLRFAREKIIGVDLHGLFRPAGESRVTPQSGGEQALIAQMKVERYAANRKMDRLLGTAPCRGVRCAQMAPQRSSLRQGGEPGAAAPQFF